MSKLMISICSCALFFVCISGCSEKKMEAELTKDNFSEFFSSKFVKAYILCAPLSKDPNRNYYHYEFPINDPKKIRVILQCIKDANHTEFDMKRFLKKTNGKNRWNFVFETKKARYNVHIGWDDKSAYGFWWESPELLSIFRGWELFKDVAKADPNWPPLKWPPPDMPDYNNWTELSVIEKIAGNDSNDIYAVPAGP